MTPRVGSRMGALFLVVLTGLSLGVQAHQDPCHRLHSCPSDGSSYVCGDKGRCDQCPDNPSCLAGKPRPAASSPTAPTPPTPMPGQPSSPGGMTVCFTPGGNCTDATVQALAMPSVAFWCKPIPLPRRRLAKRCSTPTRAASRSKSSWIRASARSTTPRPTSWRTRGYRP